MASDDMAPAAQMIDTHAHILPDLDDGPFDTDEALALARAHVAAGVTTLCATSHVDNNFWVPVSALAPAREQLRADLQREGIALDVIQGGEVALSRLGDLSEDELRSCLLGYGDTLLLECPFTLAVGDIEPLVKGLGARGIRTLLAHPERCPAFLSEPARIGTLVEAGALVQLTTGSLRGDFGTPVRRFALRLLEEGNAHVLASDAHDLKRRPPGLRGLLRGGEALEEWLTLEVPAALITGREPPARPPAAERRGRRRLRGA